MPTSQQRKQLQDALMSAFPERSLLEQLLDYELDKTLNQITQDSNLKTVVYQLIQRAQAEGWLVELVRAAYKENPGNSQLKAIATELLPPETHDVPPPIILTQPNTQQQKILILAANPKGTSQLRLDEELREIEQGLQRARQRERFDIKSALAVRPRDIHRSILDFNPNIVHFSGHGAGQDGLIFEDETGQVKLINASALANLFKLFADHVQCVVLNACYSEIQAKAIARHIDYVIGMSQAVGDRAAIEFAVGFYDALGAGRSIEFAHELGCSSIQMHGIGEELTPKLLDKKQIVDSPSANQQNFNPQTNVVIETRSTVVTAPLDDDLNTEFSVSQSDRKNSNQKDDIPVICPDSKEVAIAEYRKKVEEFAKDGVIDYGESAILKNLQKKLKLTEEEVRAVRDEVLESFGSYKENLDEYRQVFTKWVDELGYPLAPRASSDLKKLQEHYKLKDEDVALVFEQAEQLEAEKLRQQEEAEILRQEHRKAEYQAKLQRYEQELSKAVNVAYPLDENARKDLKKFQQSLGIKDEDVALIEQSVIAPKEAEYQRQLETQRLEQEQQEAQRRQQPTPSDDLSSDCNVDYTRLRDLLKAGQWKQANEETLAVMLKVTGRDKVGWLSSESIKNFPCTDLRTIDQLWVKYSNGRFGFSVQKRIWESVGKNYEKFGVRVGWRKGWWMNKEWIMALEEVTYDTTAPQGHLPYRWGGRGVLGGWVVGVEGGCGRWEWRRVSSLASRLVNCNI